MMNTNFYNAKPYYSIESGYDQYYICRADHPALSLKCMFDGPATYETEDGGRYVVDDQAFLILNHDQPYTLIKDSVVPIDSFCVFFSPEWTADILASLTLPDTPLLDEPMMDRQTPFHFFEQLYPYEGRISAHIQTLRFAFRQEESSPSWIEEQLWHLLSHMVQTQWNVFKAVEQLPAIRSSTRLELYRRLHRAKDFIHATLAEPLTLAEMAGVALMSPHHFLRAFKQAFGVTPHVYLTQLRLNRAQYLLTYTTQSVTDICFAVGFQSLGSFSTLFRRELGLSPRAFRQQVAR